MRDQGKGGIFEIYFVLGQGDGRIEVKRRGGGFRVKWEGKYSWGQGVETVPMEVMGYPTYI